MSPPSVEENDNHPGGHDGDGPGVLRADRITYFHAEDRPVVSEVLPGQEEQVFITSRRSADGFSLVLKAGLFETIATGPTLSESLHQLANALEALGAGGDGEVTSAGSRKKTCDKCGADIFFCKNKNGKWIPLEAQTFIASELPIFERWVTFYLEGEFSCRQVSKSEGRVHPSHFYMCGSKDEPEVGSERVKAHWSRNQDMLIGKTDKAGKALESILLDLDSHESM